MASRTYFLALSALFIQFNSAVSAAADDCGQAAFSAVVAQASDQLEALNAKNKHIFQEKLAVLKQRNGWSDEEAVAKARPLVQDQTISKYDARNQELLAQVPVLGQQVQPVALRAGIAPSIEQTEDPLCAMVEKLRGLMGRVVENTQAKWSYMLGKADIVLSASPNAE